MSAVGEFGMWLAIGAGQVMFWWAMSPVIRAIANRIAGKGALAQVGELEARLAALEQRGFTTDEVESQFERLAEVEERLDFTERMLAAHTNPGGLPAGGAD
jgi:hypothetical protein